jgi:hypothetical protein
MRMLAELQHGLRAALLGGDAGPAEAVVAADGLRPEARLAIYRHHVTTSLTAVLRDTYRVVCRLVGEPFFGYAADSYIRREPPAGPCLFEYGAGFPDFLAAFPPCRALPYLPDVAQLEWTLNRAYHAEDAEAPAPAALTAALATVPAAARGRLTFTFDASVMYLASAYPVDLVWRANQGPDDAGPLVDLASGTAHLEIRRAGDDAVFRPLPRAEWTLRAALAAGRSLEDAGGAALTEDAHLDLVGAIVSLLSDGILTGVTLTSPTEETLTC